MDKFEYAVHLRSIFSLAALVRHLKIADVLDAMSVAESVAPIVDPTLFLRASGSLERQKRVVEAALQFQQVVEGVVNVDGNQDCGDPLGIREEDA